MGLVTIVWSMEAAVAFTLAALCGLAWLGERRGLDWPIFLFTALGAMAGMRCEVGMMHAATAAEYGQWLRWYHFPVFIVITGYLFLIRSYLGTGRQVISEAWFWDYGGPPPSTLKRRRSSYLACDSRAAAF
jgi:hypothetical protein